jgi:phosphatidylinositol alpha 1,6-mannosyltransferase
MEETIMSLLCRPFHRADAVVAPSEFGARILRERGVGKVHVISNGVLFESGPPMVPRALNKDGQVRCIYVGRLQREKYVAEVIEGVAVAHRLGANVRLTIVGRGPDEHALRKAAARFGIAKEVVFAGYLPPSKLAAARKWATVACIASRHELQCCSALEAMADGLPVLAARCGALPETVPDGHAGLIFEPGAVSDLGQLIYKLGEDATAYGRYSEGALATAAMHSIDKTVKRMRGLYHEVTTSCRTVQAASV